MLRISALLLITGSITSCQKDVVIPNEIVDGDAATTPRALYSQRNINFNNYSNGTYTQANAVSDFGNVAGWEPSRTYISNGQLRVTLLKNDLGSSGGLNKNVDIPDHTQYTLEYDVKFHTQFDWSRGGKIGFGFRIGSGTSECQTPNGDGGSARLMWTTNGGNVPPRFKPYCYFYGTTSNCGEDFGKYYPLTGGLQKGVWYTVKIYVKSNNGNNEDGIIKYTINGTVVYEAPIRWTNNSDYRKITKLAVANYRGGGTDDWMSDTDGHIYFDNISWSSPYGS